MAESSAAKLEPYVLLAKNAKGKAVAKIIEDATSAPGVYVFGELLESPSVQQIRDDPEGSKSFNLLQQFAYGDLRTVANNRASLPDLSPAQLKKLQHLTLLSLASESRSISYLGPQGDKILQLLQLSSIRELEDMIIDVIYSGQLHGKIHHHERIFHIEWVAGRDVSPEKLVEVQLRLTNWCKTAETLLVALDNQIGALQAYSAEEAKRNAAFQQARDQAYLEATKSSEKEQASRPAQFTPDEEPSSRLPPGLQSASGAVGGRGSGSPRTTAAWVGPLPGLDEER